VCKLYLHEQVWVCVRVDSAPPGADCPPPPDLACFVYDEEEGEFFYWGPNSILRLTKAAVEPRRW
jgi:hypothetical protein